MEDRRDERGCWGAAHGELGAAEDAARGTSRKRPHGGSDTLQTEEPKDSQNI